MIVNELTKKQFYEIIRGSFLDGKKMFLHFDIKTIMTMLFMGNITVLILLFFYNKNLIKNVYYKQFTIGKLFQSFAWLLLERRGEISDISSVYIGNTILFLGFAFETLSIINSDNSFGKKKKLMFFMVIVIEIFIFYLFGNNPNKRVAIASIITLTAYGFLSFYLFSDYYKSKLKFSIGLFYFIFCFVMFFRFYFSFFEPTEFSLLTQNKIQVISFLYLYILMVVSNVGFLLIIKEYDDKLLHESEEKYRTLVERANEAISIIQDNCFVFINQRMTELLQIPINELIGKPFIDFVYPEDREFFLSNYKKRIAGEVLSSAYDFRILNAKSKIIWVFISATKINWNGKPASLTLLTDVTYRKEMEREKEKIIQELQTALSEIKTLSGMLPICASCKKIRDDNGYWNQIETYIKKHSEAEFSHSICPDCAKKLYHEYLDE